MAIFHLQHRAIGKKTHRDGFAAAHLRYILREQAATRVLGDLPGGELTRKDAARWFTERELNLRSNGRIADRIIVALPIELDHEARALAISDFVRQLDPGGRIAWISAVHDAGEDADNPHAHIMLVDADRDTGKRVLMMSERGSTERVRETWETVVNQALEREGVDARIDRRSLKAQGIDREPTFHIGPERLTEIRVQREEVNVATAEVNLADEQAIQSEEIDATNQADLERLRAAEQFRLQHPGRFVDAAFVDAAKEFVRGTLVAMADIGRHTVLAIRRGIEHGFEHALVAFKRGPRSESLTVDTEISLEPDGRGNTVIKRGPEIAIDIADDGGLEL